MIATLTIIGLVIFCLLLIASVVQLARIKLSQDALIRALQSSVQTAKDNCQFQTERADAFSKAIKHQNSRIGLLVTQNGELEDVNAFLQRVCRANAYLMILSMPTLDGPRVLERTTKISLN